MPKQVLSPLELALAQVGLGAEHYIPNLIIGTDLTAADEGRVSHIIAEWHRSKGIGECGIFQSAADVSADVETGPAPQCCLVGGDAFTGIGKSAALAAPRVVATRNAEPMIPNLGKSQPPTSKGYAHWRAATITYWQQSTGKLSALRRKGDWGMISN